MNPITQLWLEKEGEGLSLDYTPASQKQNHFSMAELTGHITEAPWGLQVGETGVILPACESVGSYGFRVVHYGLYTQ